ncbi:hypothetical protein LTR56_010746 [Elasticomyces elasticus]|nr:hypothetical protein LTR56_010746 [Elasticomyces elasticus]KAK3667770.1 hypothetical protein LTR22_001215 [Elasticomyces elasticus]KAK4932236.1 hypothetical protein LTR49_001533 [Elasticomyces elasticus]KAK5745593.1 hypothetical protein LTS12_023075 [Elasticomyces elasticus]
MHTRSTKAAADAAKAVNALLQRVGDGLQSKDECWVSPDYGTINLMVAVAIKKPGVELTRSDIVLVHFGEGLGKTVPQRGGWDSEKRFRWGHGVDEAIQQGLMKYGDAIEQPKLLLYTGFETSAIVARGLQKLENPPHGPKHTLEDFYAAHFNGIWEETKEYIRSRFGHKYTAKDLESMEVRGFLPVPNLWEEPAIEKMLSAARKAGLQLQPVLEAHCVAGVYAYNNASGPKGLRVGAHLTIVDAGGGTVEFTSIRYDDPLTQGATARVTGVGKSTSAICGSQLVNEECIQHMMDEARRQYPFGGWEYLCGTVLGISTENAIYQINASFETLKIQFTHIHVLPKPLGIVGVGNKTWGMAIGSAEMVRFFRPAIAQMSAGILDQRNQLQALGLKQDAISLQGGFGMSKYVCDQLSLSHPGIPITPNEAGYRNMQDQEAPIGVFGVTLVEVYDPNQHHDCNIPHGAPIAGVTRPDPTKVSPDPFDKSIDVTFGRWNPFWLMDGIVPGTPITYVLWQMVCSYVTDYGVFKQQIWWTKSDILKGRSIIARGQFDDEEGAVMLPGVQRYGQPLTFDHGRLDRLGFTRETPKGQPQFYRTWQRLTVTRDDMSVTFRSALAKPNSILYDHHDRFNPHNATLTEEDVCNMIEPSFNPTVRTNPN